MEQISSFLLIGMQFKDIIGQEQVKTQLRLAVQEGRVPHAQLLSGQSGIGKLRLALAYAQYLNCPHRTEEDSCGICPTCLQFSKLQHPDLHLVFPIVKDNDKKRTVCDDYVADFRTLVLEKGYFDLNDWYGEINSHKQGMIYDEESAKIVQKLSLKSFGQGYKVVIIWQADKMNVTCANKLLKLLEEPTDKTVFILISEVPDRLLTTILSRVQQIRVPNLKDEEIAAALTQYDGVQPAEALQLAHIANGSYLVAKKWAESSEENKKELDDFISLMRSAYTIGSKKDPQKKFDALKQFRQWSLEIADAGVGREGQKHFLQYAQRQVRENFIYNLQHPEMNYQTADEQAFSAKFSPFIHAGNIENIMNELDKAERQIEQNGNAKIIFFDLCLQMIVLIKRPRP